MSFSRFLKLLFLFLSWNFVSCSSPTATSATPSPFPQSGGSLAAAQFVGSLKLVTFGVTAVGYGFFSKEPGTGFSRALTTNPDDPSTAFSEFVFYLGDSNNDTFPIVGYDVYRSTDNINWSKVATVNSVFTSNSSNPIAYLDWYPGFTLGTTYYYRIQAFDSYNHSNPSPSLGLTFLPPFTLNLDSSSFTGPTAPTMPLSLSSVSSQWLQFSISNPSLWSLSVANYFYFSLVITDMVGGLNQPDFYGELRYDFGLGQFEAPQSYSTSGAAVWTDSAGNPTYNTVSSILWSNGTISIPFSALSSFIDNNAGLRSSTVQFVSGYTYQWNIFGSWYGVSYGSLGSGGAMSSAYFIKQGASSGQVTSEAISNSNSYEKNFGASNGYFQFQVQ
jgi:hypothetical protein